MALGFYISVASTLITTTPSSYVLDDLDACHRYWWQNLLCQSPLNPWLLTLALTDGGESSCGCVAARHPEPPFGGHDDQLLPALLVSVPHSALFVSLNPEN